MFKGRWSGNTGIWKPKNPHSLEYLKYLYGVLSKNTTVTENNRSLLVEALRSIAEILIWGDQNDSTVFDFFLEKNMLAFFLRIMKQKCGRYICTQLLQTLNILFENIRHETSLYYLLSNNHVNSIITHRFDFSDEEILAYYISFLKTLSMKLNNNTIHFFFNEVHLSEVSKSRGMKHTHDFPLYTEAIKFFNHSESMVRIAVRTLTLNVYKVPDDTMLMFICDKTAAPYFSNFVWFICNHIVEIDICAQSDASSSSLDKLSDLIAEHLDHIHYVNDILCLSIESLNDVLTDQLLRKLLLPICLGSLVPNIHVEGPHVSQVVALFLLSQVFIILTYRPLVSRLAFMLLYGDRSVFAASLSPQKEGSVPSDLGNVPSDQEVLSESCSDEEKMQRLLLQKDASLETDSFPQLTRPLYCALLNTLDCSVSDHATFYSLCLLYAIVHNNGLDSDFLDSCGLSAKSCDKEASSPTSAGVVYNDELISRLLRCLVYSTSKASDVRIATVDLVCLLLRDLIRYSVCLKDPHLAVLFQAHEQAMLLMQEFYSKEEMFLDLFEDEYHEFSNRRWNISFLSSDATFMLPPVSTSLSGIDLTKRLPCGIQEQARRAIRVFMLLRSLMLSLNQEPESKLPLTNKQDIVNVDDCLNLNNSDLLSCIIMQNEIRLKRFLVTDGLQMILVEPDSKMMGWGVVRFVGFLQDMDVTGDKEDSRALHITLHQPAAKMRASAKPLLAAKFVFDDHIRCMAAKQRLTKGRQKARQYKMNLIADLLEIKQDSAMQVKPAPVKKLVYKSAGRVPGYASQSIQSEASNSIMPSSLPLGTVLASPKAGTSSPASSATLSPCPPSPNSTSAKIRGYKKNRSPSGSRVTAAISNFVSDVLETGGLKSPNRKSASVVGSPGHHKSLSRAPPGMSVDDGSGTSKEPKRRNNGKNNGSGGQSFRRRKVRVLSIGSIAQQSQSEIPMEHFHAGRNSVDSSSDDEPTAGLSPSDGKGSIYIGSQSTNKDRDGNRRRSNAVSRDEQEDVDSRGTITSRNGGVKKPGGASRVRTSGPVGDRASLVNDSNVIERCSVIVSSGTPPILDEIDGRWKRNVDLEEDNGSKSHSARGQETGKDRIAGRKGRREMDNDDEECAWSGPFLEHRSVSLSPTLLRHHFGGPLDSSCESTPRHQRAETVPQELQHPLDAAMMHLDVRECPDDVIMTDGTTIYATSLETPVIDEPPPYPPPPIPSSPGPPSAGAGLINSGRMRKSQTLEDSVLRFPDTNSSMAASFTSNDKSGHGSWPFHLIESSKDSGVDKPAHVDRTDRLAVENTAGFGLDSVGVKKNDFEVGCSSVSNSSVAVDEVGFEVREDEESWTGRSGGSAAGPSIQCFSAGPHSRARLKKAVVHDL